MSFIRPRELDCLDTRTGITSELGGIKMTFNHFLLVGTSNTRAHNYLQNLVNLSIYKR